MAAVEAEPDGALIAERVCATVDPHATPPSSEETFWAIRRLLETLARNRALVVCLEDVHWAQPAFLDLLEYVAGWSRNAPILLLCLARAGAAGHAAALGRSVAVARAAHAGTSRSSSSTRSATSGR